MLVNVDLTQEAHQDFRNELFKNWFLFQSIPSENFPNILFDRIVLLVIVRKAVAANLHNSVFFVVVVFFVLYRKTQTTLVWYSGWRGVQTAF